MKGLYSALLVPFDEQGNIKERGLRDVVKQNIEKQGIDGLYVNGSSGENFMLSTDVKKEIFRIVHAENAGRVKLIAQVGSINLDEAIELGQYATQLGYDSLSAVTPFYYPFSFEEIKSYYETIIAETNNQMIVYSIPALTGVSMDMTQLDDLFKNENIIGIKYTDSDFFMLERLRQRYPEKLIYSGFDEMLIHGLISGVDGAIGSTYNVNGKRAKEIMTLVADGNTTKAYEVQHRTNDLIEQIQKLGLYQTLKEILNQKGIDAGTCKKPMRGFDQSKQPEVKQLIKEFDL